MVGSAILRCFEKNGYHNLLTRTHEELDLRNESEVKAFYDAEKPEYVVIAAAKVGGIAANDRFKAEFLLENLQIQNNLIWQAYLHQVKKQLHLSLRGSAADQGGVSPDRAAGTDERGVCAGEDRRI